MGVEVKEQLEKQLRFCNLCPGDVPDIFSLCSGCVYWELPEEFARGLSSQEMQLMKEGWLAIHVTNSVLGKVARKGNELVGFIQFGPPELYPQRLSYRAGPISKDAMLITCLFVRSECRGKGLARQLLSLAIDAARQEGYFATETFARRGSANNPSGPIELYLDCGFEVVRDDEEFPLVRKAQSR